RNAVAKGLGVKSWVKTSLAPGSPAAGALLARAGLLSPLEQLGFAIVGTGCTTCIGNSGPLIPAMAAAVQAGVEAVAILSGNRNFPGRVHPQVREGFLVSPPLVIAFAIAGDAARDLSREPLCHGPDGKPVMLAELWPSSDEIDHLLAAVRSPETVLACHADAEANPDWRALDAPSSVRFPWRRDSTYLRPPPFARIEGRVPLDGAVAHVLLSLGDDITTDHISPAGAIAADSGAARYLIANGAMRDDLNVYAARRGNWEVMVRGLFTNPSVANLLDPSLRPGWTIYAPSGEAMPLWDAARAYRESRTPLVIVAGERYGAGSSRDWAAKGPWLLGVRAVIASSFERIHRSNLINMGILPLEAPQISAPDLRSLAAADRVIFPDRLTLDPGARLPLRVQRTTGDIGIDVRLAAETRMECEVLARGGMLPNLLRRLLDAEGTKQ
ncbi:aconitase family protein, partial [Sphingomonas sp.]|uniref:aconitase family protein n=1 Tax=Sphingomonas sp. TaxID=28214 RepID=UPI001ECEF49F